MNRESLRVRLEHALPDGPIGGIDDAVRRMRIHVILMQVYTASQGNVLPPIPRNIQEYESLVEGQQLSDAEFTRGLHESIRKGLDEEMRMGYSDHWKGNTHALQAVGCLAYLWDRGFSKATIDDNTHIYDRLERASRHMVREWKRRAA